MNTISSKTLRMDMKKILDAVSSGEEFVLTFHKKKIGKIVPLSKPEKSSRNLLSFLNSQEFQNRNIPKHLQDFSSFKNFHKDNYSKYDK